MYCTWDDSSGICSDNLSNSDTSSPSFISPNNLTDDQVLCFGLGVVPATLTVTGSLTGVGITYQWQSSPNGINGSLRYLKLSL